jgi:ribokinase
MSTDQCKRRTIEFLEKPSSRDCKVVVLPDYFMDRIVNLPWTTMDFYEKVVQVAQRKGGSIDGISQTDMKGGNAINMASALSNLDVAVTPIICTSDYGLQQIKYHFRATPMDFSHVKIAGKASITTALEFRDDSGKANVMIRDLGSLADFSPQNLGESDYKLIEAADYTCLFNWAGTLRHGTELAKAAFTRAKQGKGRTYYDTADPNPNALHIPELIEQILKTPLIDCLSVNENEAVTYASHLDKSFGDRKGELSFEDTAMEAARILAKHFPARIDLHTTAFSASIKGTKEVVVPSFEVNVLRATGAGDSWNAGNLLADHNDLPDDCRLMLANAVSACYLSGADGAHPTRAKVSEFLKTNA